ncbi:response regulator [Perlabentimonas gracilis]|uniref:response regulator n=1 Tax=Perlabentimonas gracilis TaxID=2715279 RepID=UPI00140E8FD7|nr:response regulator [Perlabentimonas gracilis]NHB68192.1 response regulator [Perlabentimonas gracilis]
MENIYKILIVDDIFVNRLLIKEIVKKINAQCYEAENGQQALDMFKENDIDIILMDIEMPVMNGLETTKYIREKFPVEKKNIPIIALTAHNPLTFFDDFKDVGFDQLMTKPYSVSKVLSVIQEVCK